MLNLTPTNSHDAYKEILYAIWIFNHSQHVKSGNLCLMTKLTLTPTLNDPHDAKPDTNNPHDA